MSVFLDAIRAFEKLKAPQSSGPASAVAVASERLPLTSTSDGTAAQLARISPVDLDTTNIDKQIEEKLKGDELLLQRVKTIFTSLDDKKNFLNNLDAVEKLHKNGNIEFHEIRDPSSILKRLAFQFTFIGFSSPIDPPFKLNCLGFIQKADPNATHSGSCSRNEYLNYGVSILDNDENRFLLDGVKPVFPRELVEDAELAHVTQHYLKDLLGIKQENLLIPEQFLMFMEIPEHLKILFYKSLQEPGFDMSQGLKLGEGGLLMDGHLSAKPVSDQLITKLLDWENRGLIERKDLPQCIRAYTVISSLVNPKEICIEGNEQIRQLFMHLVSSLTAEINEHKESKVLDIEKLLSKYSDIFKSRGLQEGDLTLIREVAANMSKDTDGVQEKALELNKLAPLLAPFNEQHQQFMDRLINSVLSIDDPKTLFEVAAKTIEDGGYVPPKT